MFRFLKRKEKPDPVLEMLEEQTAQLEELHKSLTKVTSELDGSINELENSLRKLGYTDMDFELLKSKSYLKVIK